MTALATVEARPASQRNLVELDALLRERGLDDAAAPWWQISLLDLAPGSLLHDLRVFRDRGRATWWAIDDDMARGVDPERLLAWSDLIDLARRSFGAMCPFDAIRELGSATCRPAACTSIRALVQFLGLLDDDLEPWVLRDFHVRGVRAMRTAEALVLLWPFAHGKSATSSLLVPLADWVENAETTQIRVYRSRDYTQQWTRKLMAVVEENEALHLLTDGEVARPDPYSLRRRLWTERDGFEINGKTVVDPSFRPLTITGGITGKRADRLGVDDLVDHRNADSVTVMGRYVDLMHTGVFTAERVRNGARWTSEYGTRWGNTYLVGTVFSKRDVNYRMYQEFREHELHGDKNYATVRESIYPYRRSRELGETLWPEKVPIAKALLLEQKLGQVAFRLRCMNLPVQDGTETFPSQWVERAVHHELEYGQRPPGGCRLLIGYDPATGKRNKGTKFPAAVALGYHPELDTWYFVRYERWPLPMPEQVRRLIAWSLELHCPVVVEGDAQQESYEDWIHDLTTQVQVITRPTGSTKHDKDDGVESFRPLFENDRIRIHAGGVQEEKLLEFKEEWTNWPTGIYRDMVMAAWFALYQFRLNNRRAATVEAPRIPSYVAGRGYRQVVDLTRYRY